MLLPTRCKGTARITALAGAVLLGLTAALAASHPGPMRVADSWRLVEPAFTLGKETTQKTKTWLKKNTRPAETLKTNPGPPDMRKANPRLPAVQTPIRK